MKKFNFTLQRMLAYKQSLYEKERNELARLRHERAALLQRQDATRVQLADKEQTFRRRAAGVGAYIEDVTSFNYYRSSAELLIQDLEEQIQRKDIEIAAQLKIVIELDRDVKGLEKLREKQWEEYQAAAAIEERERILELVSTKYLETQAENAAEQAAEEAARAQ